MIEVFPNAPITEGLIDIRVQLSSQTSLADLENLHEKIKPQYPGKRTRRMMHGTVEFKADESVPVTKAQSDIVGYLFSSSDEKQVVQFRLDGFTFSRLRPYTRWEQVYPEAVRLWEIYRDGTSPVALTRLAVRYINSIEIPLKAFDYDDYFTAAPKIPSELPQALQTFFTRIVVPFQERNAWAAIALAPSDIPDPVKTVIILDIDVFSQVNLAPGDSRIHEVFAALREIKNQIFFSSLTEKTKELFR